MADISYFTELLPPDQARMMEALHHEIMSLPGVSMKPRFKLPFYDCHTWVCYLNPLKKGGVELCFIRGNELSNPFGLLQMKGRRQIAGIHCESIADVPWDLLRDTLHEALLLDRELSKKPLPRPSQKS